MSQKSRPLVKNILRLLLPMMLLLVLFDSVVLHNLAIHALQKELDADLDKTALQISDDIKEFISETNKDVNQYHTTEDVNSYLLQNDMDKISFCIMDINGVFLNGDKSLYDLTANFSKFKSPLFITNNNDEKLRVLNLTFNLKKPLNFKSYQILIASTLNYRNQLANKILFGVVIPQLLLVLMSFSVIFASVTKGIEPLNSLQIAIANRSEKNLNPIKLLPEAPLEIIQLSNAINNLMQRISNLISIQNDFIADAAHQLRTPLSGALAQLEVAEQDDDLIAIKSTLPKVYQSLDRLQHIINQLLSLAKNQHDVATTIKMTVVDLNLIAKEILLEIAPLGIQKNIDLGFEASDKPSLLLGNAEQLKVLLYNLVDNAIRYTPNHGKVTISITVTNASVELLVADNGPGVAEELRDKIFERFYRVGESVVIGSGLGLAIVKEIANLHNAKISTLTQKNLSGLHVLVTFKLASV